MKTKTKVSQKSKESFHRYAFASQFDLAKRRQKVIEILSKNDVCHLITQVLKRGTNQSFGKVLPSIQIALTTKKISVTEYFEIIKFLTLLNSKLY